MKQKVSVLRFSFQKALLSSTTDGNPDVQLSTTRTNSTHIDNFNANIQGDGALYVNANAQKGDGEIMGDNGEVALVKILLPENSCRW